MRRLMTLAALMVACMPLTAGAMQSTPASAPACTQGKLTVDLCGRVQSAQVKQPSRKAFNDAALDSVKGVTLIPELRAKAVDGRVELPITFSINSGG